MSRAVARDGQHSDGEEPASRSIISRKGDRGPIASTPVPCRGPCHRLTQSGHVDPPYSECVNDTSMCGPARPTPPPPREHLGRKPGVQAPRKGTHDDPSEITLTRSLALALMPTLTLSLTPTLALAPTLTLSLSLCPRRWWWQRVPPLRHPQHRS